MSLDRRPVRRIAATATAGWLATALLGSLALPGTAMAYAGPAVTTNLGAIGFADVAVDPVHAHVFVSGPQGNVVDELTYGGSLVTSINVPAPRGLLVSGQYLYVVESVASPNGAIARIDLDTATPTPTTLATGLNSPGWIAGTGGELWVTESGSLGSGYVNLTEVDPATGAVARFAGNPAMQNVYGGDLATSPGAPSTLFVSEDGLSPGTIERIDVSGTPTVVATTPNSQSQYGDVENIGDLAVSPDGSRVIPAAGATQDTTGYTHYRFDEFAGSSLLPDGVTYPGAPYPSAVATSPNGLLATGLDNGSLVDANNQPIADIDVFTLGGSTPSFSGVTANSSGSSNVRPHGLALEPSGTYLFAVTADDVYSTNTLFNAFSLSSTASPPPTIKCATAPSGWSASNVALACTATDNSGAGLANPADASFTLSTSVPAGSFSQNALTGSRQVCDADGNCATAGPLGPVMVDLAPPTATIATPANGSSFKRNATVKASYTCADSGSGVASCTGTVANGSPLDTAKTGTFTFSVTATDVAGNATKVTSTYTIAKH